MVYDSLLSEYAALGFEYGYSTVQRDALVAWEAQFGDFVNGAQIIIDQFLVASGPKWGQSCGLVLLLPHGYEGQGAEHSSARIERFLLLAAEDNIQVTNPTTAAQLFHLLRRQVHRTAKKPLIVCTPKKYLRGREAYSKVEEFVHGHFHEVLDDPGIADRDAVKRVILASGKMALDLMGARAKRLAADGGAAEVAVVRLEQLYPWPEDQIADMLAGYEHATEVMWVQEEPENMGGWTLRARSAASPPSRRLPASPCRSGSVRITGGWQPGPAHPRAGGLVRTSLCPRSGLGRLDPQLNGKPTTASSSPRATSGSVTLIVVIPNWRAGLRLTPRSSRKTTSDGSTSNCRHTSS